MDRRSVLQSVFAALAVQASASDANAQIDGNTQGAVQRTECLLSGKDTGGALSVFGGKRKPLGGGVPLHIHHDQDEFWYIVEGETLVQIGDRKFVAKPGEIHFGPRGVPHSHRRLTPGMGIGGYIRAGTMEEFFLKVAERRQKDPKAALDDLFMAHGMTIVGPSA